MGDVAPGARVEFQPLSGPSLSSFSLHDEGNGKCSTCYALDTEMVTVVGPGDAPSRRVCVSIGVVDQNLEVILYSRVRIPEGSEVVDGTFARLEGKLRAGWEEGIPLSVVRDLIKGNWSRGGVLVGWELKGDLNVLGFLEAAEQIDDNVVQEDASLGSDGSANNCKSGWGSCDQGRETETGEALWVEDVLADTSGSAHPIWCAEGGG
ncbi:unnamed protein product, partial [Discosporangium mesarthrocarpum]